MKKIYFLFLSVTMIFATMTGCREQAVEDEISFTAMVLETSSYLLVEPVAGSQELRSADKIVVYVKDETQIVYKDERVGMESIEPGMAVEIFYDGAIAESYPAQLYGGYKIRVLDYEAFTDQDENFRIKTVINKLAFEENEEVRIYSTIEYMGEEESITVWSAKPYFHYTIYDGEAYLNMAMTNDILMQTVFEKGKTYTIPFSKNGGYSEDDPKADFWRKYFSEKELKLPGGTYLFATFTSFSLNEEQTEKVELKTEFEVKVN